MTATTQAQACVIVWFRRDLRLADNPALQAALASGLPVLTVYLHAPEEEGAWAPGAAAQSWLGHSLHALERSLRARGGMLLIRTGPSQDALQRLCAETGARAVYWNRRYEPLVRARDSRIKQTLRDQGLTVASYNAALWLEPWEVQNGSGEPYRVFTPFWRKARERISERPPEPTPTHDHDHDLRAGAAIAAGLASLPIDDLRLAPANGWDRGFYPLWQPGEEGASQRLGAFLDDHLSDYSDARNRPDRPGCSRLSPHLAWGEISPRQILAAIHARPDTVAASEAFVRELGWREFSWHLLYHFPHTVEQNLDDRFDSFVWAEPDPRLLAAWQRGRTGVPIIDAGMRELWQTGYMHNRVRMLVASFLTKNLRYHWRHGARWFFDTLVDADLANNTQGWQWSAGTGADAAPYFRVFNPVLQGQRFDPDGHYVRAFVPELAGLPTRHIHQPWLLDHAALTAHRLAASVYAQPVLDLASTRAAALAAYASRHSERAPKP